MSVLTKVNIHRVCPCACTDHVNLMLHDPASDRYVRVRISASAGRAIVSELNDLASAEGEVVDALSAVISALGSRITAVRLSTDGKQTWAHLEVSSPSPTPDLTVDASPALVAASRLNIPVFIEDADELPSTDIPDVFKAAFE